jgi:YbbR domain-containing protein
MMRRMWPFRHVGLKVMSLGIAVVLWMTVSGEETVERGLRVPLELQQFPADLEIQGEAPSTVDVRVRGTSGALSRVAAGDIVAVLDLHGARAGNRLFAVTPEQVHVPFGVEVVQVTPSTVALAFESSVTRDVPVVASIEGMPAPGYVMGKVTVSPERVEIVGPESAVKRAREALTETISIADLRDPLSEDVTVGLIDPALRLKAQRTVTVTVEIVPGPLERTVRSRPIHLRNLGPHLSAQAVPVVVDVGLRGSREALTRIDADAVSAYIDVAGLGAGDYTLAVHAEASNQAGVTHVDPATVQVRIASAKD